MGKGRPFLEVFTSALKENYRFPILEVFAFLYAIATFLFAALGATFAQSSSEAFAHNLVNSMTGFPLFIFVVLILVNTAYGLGNDVEKGVIQTLLSYPLKRRTVLTAKLLSALGIALLLFLGIQVTALFLLTPDIITHYFGTVLLSYLASLSTAFLIAGIVLVVALVLKRGGLAVVIGIVFYFALSIMSTLVSFIVYTGSDLPFRIYAIIAPNMVLDRYYGGGIVPFFLTGVWVPTFSDVLLYVGASYILVACVFALGYVYFDRRLGI